MTSFVNVDLACNNEHGHFERSTLFVDFALGQHHVGLASTESPIDVQLPAGALVVAGVHYPCHGRESHVGNLCWERAMLMLDDARRLMRQLFEAGWDLDEWTEGSPFQGVIRKAGHDV